MPRPRAKPSWPTVLATTVRLWIQRRRRRVGAASRSRRDSRWTRIAALAVVLLLAAGLGLVLSRVGTNSPAAEASRPGGPNPVLTAQAARDQAAVWISRQVGRGTIVACDPVMCSDLLARGLPAGNLDSLGPGAPDPLNSEVIAATAVLRSQFGPRLASVYAPVVMARFGTGTSEVDVRVVAPDGSRAYLREFRADLAERKAYGRAVLHNSKILAGPAARRQLAGGMVDSRLLVTIATAAQQQAHPLRILSFGRLAPGASPGVPLDSAIISSRAGEPAAAAVMAGLRRFWLGQRAPYLPASTQIVRDASGRSALRIQYAAPSPLGLLGPGPPVVKIPSR